MEKAHHLGLVKISEQFIADPVSMAHINGIVDVVHNVGDDVYLCASYLFDKLEGVAVKHTQVPTYDVTVTITREGVCQIKAKRL